MVELIHFWHFYTINQACRTTKWRWLTPNYSWSYYIIKLGLPNVEKKCMTYFIANWKSEHQPNFLLMYLWSKWIYLLLFDIYSTMYIRIIIFIYIVIILNFRSLFTVCMWTAKWYPVSVKEINLSHLSIIIIVRRNWIIWSELYLLKLIFKWIQWMSKCKWFVPFHK